MKVGIFALFRAAGHQTINGIELHWALAPTRYDTFIIACVREMMANIAVNFMNS